MADVNPTETGLTVKICDGTASEMVAVLTTTPSSSEAALVVREVERAAEYAEDSVHTDGDTGQFVLTVRNDTLATLVDTDGDYAPLQVNGSGALYVDINGSGDVSVATNSEYAEDSVHTSGDVGQFVLAVRNDTLAALAGTDGDYAPLQVSADGALYVEVAANTGSNQVEGDVAHDDVDSGNPVKIGGKAAQTNPTAVADADRSDIMVDDVGRVVTVSSHVRDLVVKEYTEISNSSENTVLTAGGAGVFHDITAIYMASSTNNVEVIIRDSTGGSTVWEAHIDQDVPFKMLFNPPLPQDTANNNWTMERNTGSGNLQVLVVAVKNV